MASHDDFFGIEYESGKKDENIENRVMEEEIERYAMGERREWSEMETEKMSGTEFIDASFFPELKEMKNEDGKWKRGEEGTKSIWEEQYFQRREGEEDLSGMIVNDERGENRRSERPQKAIIARASSSTSMEENDRPSGLDQIRSEFFPFWTLTEDQLIEDLCKRVIYNDGEMLAIDKPKGMLYSGEKDSKRYQLDRMTSKVKDRIAPKCERLHPVLTLDKDSSGVTLFTTNPLLRSELVERMRNGEITIKTDCIVRGLPSSAHISIHTPLLKSTKAGQLKMWPAKEGDARGIKVKSGVKKIKGNDAHSHVEVETTCEIPHQIRAHLSLIGLPLLGDQVYGRKKGVNGPPMRYPSQTLNALDLSRNQSSKLPMFIHRREMVIPSVIATKPGVSIMAPLPSHFTLILKKLSLLRKMKYI